jgi:zinc transport system permease protein
MILFGWAVALVGASFAPHGDELGRALVQGQIYFTGAGHLEGIAALTVLSAALLPWLSPRLLLGRFFPDHFRANGKPNPHHDVVFDVLVAITLALSATAIGVMAAFAAAIRLDQPFGPVLVAALLLVALARPLARG